VLAVSKEYARSMARRADEAKRSAPFGRPRLHCAGADDGHRNAQHRVLWCRLNALAGEDDGRTKNNRDNQPHSAHSTTTRGRLQLHRAPYRNADAPDDALPFTLVASRVVSKRHAYHMPCSKNEHRLRIRARSAPKRHALVVSI
jgi:hypothetical protein